MTEDSLQPAFPIARAVAWMLGVAALAVAAAYGLAVMMWPGDATALRAAVGLAGFAAVAGVLSVLPVGMFGSFGVMATVKAWFLGMFVRLGLCMAAGWLATLKLEMPGPAVAVGLACGYLPTLFVETALVGRYLWAKDSLPSAARTADEASQSEITT